MTDEQIRFEKLRERVKNKGISVARLCKAAGISQAAWQYWKAQKFNPKGVSLTALENALKGMR